MLQSVAFVTSLILSVVGGREFSRASKVNPPITHSLINLGKMDVNFYFNTNKDQVQQMKQSQPTHLVKRMDSSSSSQEEPCPCSNLKNIGKDSSLTHNPSHFLNKLLMSNDLFSYNKDPTVSTLCCGSHEQIHEEIILDFSKPNMMNSFPVSNHLSASSLHDDIIIPFKPNMPRFPAKQKAIEIFFFPKKKEVTIDLSKAIQKGKKDAVDFGKKSEDLNKKQVQFVGGKELKNEFSSLKFRPSFSIATSSNTVKKDLNIQDKGIPKIIGVDTIDPVPASRTVINNDNLQKV